MVFFPRRQNNQNFDKNKFQNNKNNNNKNGSTEDYSRTEETSEIRVRQSHENESIDSKYGFDRVKDVEERIGWLLNMHPTEVLNEDKRLVAAVDYFFIKEDGTRFKSTMAFQPYFYILPKEGYEREVSLHLSKKYGAYVTSADFLSKEDLDLPNHLVGLKQKYLKLSFPNVSDLLRVRKDLLPMIRKNKEREKSNTAYAEILRENYIGDVNMSRKLSTNHLESIIDIREYDVPYHVRVSIDNKIFVGNWYSVTLRTANGFNPNITRRTDLIESPDCIVLAYDIETTKLPLKFPDSSFDQIMMISYMIDGQGFLITNREIISRDIDDFEFSPKPEFESTFTIFNEQNEMELIQRFFDHILDIRPHIISSYNGDFFDWPFIEARANILGLNMEKEIGFAQKSDGCYFARPCIHMDCINWVRRDSYLPVGSHGLKAVARTKLRYDPEELDPEEMCRMAAEQPQILSNYSVSDAVATYYLYMQYVHPFIFALCTIIPMEPDEVLRKGSGTLCETLLMVEAFHANIIFPNKQETILNKMTNDGHVLDQETYVGGHVEALESGVFRSDIKTRFRLTVEIFNPLIEGVEKTLRHALEEEEKIPLDQVLNFDEVAAEIKEKLTILRDNPVRLEFPVIYHLDVGAMYPNIILTNRLQPSAMADEVRCAACDFNKPGARCQRKMAWTWRGEYMPASRSEFHRIQQQLEMERFPPIIPGGVTRAFHELGKEECATIEKKRLQEYCRKAYRKVHVTKIEEKYQTVCQKENSFYVDTVRAFRDRRYEYKAMTKVAKKKVEEAVVSGDAGEIKSAKGLEIVYDSLQLAHKCILNSFYGYVMRKGARWHSMEMAGIVCHTGGNIIRKAREIIEKVGRPLELDTDGIWCMLPSSFPENFVIETSIEKKGKISVSYPNALLNLMVKEEFTNEQYHELVDKDNIMYDLRNENSIFFEVDGPYLAMILPAAKEEGKKLKKRYAVFNKDKSLAELKGFEVKRRGELQLIKNFQSSVFDAFLNGDSLETSYASVAKVADYWLDVLYSKALDMPDSELFDLISENRSMSRKLEDYGSQKSTSISTAKRLAEFLGDQMVKDAGLSCKFIISKKPDGAPVTERAIPLAIFQAEPSVKKHFLKRWLKNNSMIDFEIRSILDWDYYIERLAGTIQKIVTIPAALQGVSNPVPRVAHPEWLHKRILEKADVFKQRKINDMFKIVPKTFSSLGDIEDISGPSSPRNGEVIVNANVMRKRNRSAANQVDYTKTWRETFGPPPPIGDDAESIQEWLSYHKKKWAYQAKQKEERTKRLRMEENDENENGDLLLNSHRPGKRNTGPVTIGGFLRRNQQNLIDSPWQIIQVVETGTTGSFRLWALIDQELHLIRLNVPRIFYLNLREPKPYGEAEHWRKTNKILPRSHPVYNLYEYSIPENIFNLASNDLLSDLSTPNVEGIYETKMPLEFRVIVNLGCVCAIDRKEARKMKEIGDTFDLQQLNMRSIQYNPEFPYMPLSVVKHIFLYQYKSGNKGIIGIFIPVSSKAFIFVNDSARSNQMPNLVSLYKLLRNEKLSKGDSADNIPDENMTFEIKFETDQGAIFRGMQRILQTYKDEKRGPTFIAIQSQITFQRWTTLVPLMYDFPAVPIHIQDAENLFSVLDWQRVGSRIMLKHFLRIKSVLDALINQSRYYQVPIGNIPIDSTLYGCDLFYARQLNKQNIILWTSNTDRPDFGGKEVDDTRLVSESEEQNCIIINNPASYQSICVELELDGLAVNTILHSQHVHDIEGTSSSTAFDTIQQASVAEFMEGNNTANLLAAYDETALCTGTFRVLKSVVSSWLRDVSVHRNLLADFQLVNFYRWLRTPNALLYDPALRKTLNNLMKKLFIQLVAEFMNLRSLIVYADFTKIIICTKKNRIEDAMGYVDYVINAIKSKELFQSIDIKVQTCWEFLLWLDLSNFGGIKVVEKKAAKIKVIKIKDHNNKKGKKKKQRKRIINPDSDSEDDEEDSEDEDSELEVLESHSEEEDEDEDDLQMIMNWNIINHIPDVFNCKSNFKIVIESYIRALYYHITSELNEYTPGTTPVLKRNSQITPRRRHDNPLIKDSILFAKDLIKGELSQNLFLIIQKMDKKYPNYIKPSDSDSPHFVPTPELIGKPSLEFVKAITKILALDHNISDEVNKLRRDLLKLINIGEFSNQSKWQDQCMSLILPEVICKVCNQCRDIDLCRDTHVSLENEVPVWICPSCKVSYETKEIEHSLVDLINKKLMAYFTQDLQCTKCQEIKEDNMFTKCTCSGTFKTVIDRNLLTMKLKAFRDVAIHFGMPLLQQNAEWVLDLYGN